MGNVKRSRWTTHLRRIVTAVFTAAFCFSFLSSFQTFAAANIFVVKDAKLTELSENAEGNIASFNELEIKSNVTFHKVGDTAKYTLTIKNNSSEDRLINYISDDNDSNYLSYEYDNFSNSLIKANESFDFIVTVKYENAVPNLSERTQISNVKFLINYTDGQVEIPLVPDTSGSITNKAISDAIKTNTIVIIISTIGLIVCIILAAKKHKGSLKIVAGLIALVSTITITTSVKALGIEVNTISFDNTYELADKVAITYNIDGNEVTESIGYNTKITKVPQKPGNDFSGWKLEDGSDFNPETPVTNDLVLTANFTPSAVAINFDAHGLNFANGKTSNIIEYKKTCHEEPVPTIAHTSNLNDDGSYKRDDYNEIIYSPDEAADKTTLTVPGAHTLKVTLKYSIEEDYDSLYIFKGNYNGENPSQSGDYGQVAWYSRNADDYEEQYTDTLTIEGDTITFFYTSDSSVGYYGYFASIEGYDENGNSVMPTTTVCDKTVTSGRYAEPETAENQVFYGWSEDPSATQADYKSLQEVITAVNAELGETKTVYAIWEEREVLSVKLHGNGLKFNDDTDTTTLRFAQNCQTLPVETTQYSHTSNIDDNGNASGNYSNSLATKHVVKVPGAKSLQIRITYATEDNYDYLYVFKGEYTGSVTRQMSAGQLVTYNGGYSTQSTFTITVEGDTATFAFYSDGSDNYYGYYAVINGLNESGNIIESGETYESCERELIAGEYKEPITNHLQEFGGWAEDPDAEFPEYFDEDELINGLQGSAGETKHYYAIWAKKHTVHFDGNGATSGTMNDQLVYGGYPNYLDFNTYRRDNYTFLGWSTDKNATEIEYANNGEFIAPDNYETTTLYAVWKLKHHIIYDGNGATSGNVSAGYYDSGSRITLRSNGYAKTNYDFLGWSTDKDAVLPQYAADSTFIVPTDTEETIFYAIWVKKHRVIFDGNGATSGTMDDRYYTRGTNITIPSIAYTRQNYLFLGWATSSSVNIPIYTDGGSFTVPTDSDETTLYAIWVKKHTVHFNGNGATSGTMNDKIMAAGGTVNLPDNAFVKTNYAFSGWSEDPNATISDYQDKASFTAPTETTETTLYAIWRAKPVVHFNGNGATSGTMTDQAFEFNTAASLTYNRFSRTDYSFLGWSEDKNATTETYKNGASFTPPTDRDETTLYAVWKHHFILHYDKNGIGEGTMEDSAWAWNSATQRLKWNTFEATGLYVAGWSTDPNATTPIYEDNGVFTLPTDGTQEITLYAVWKPAYTIHYNGNDSTAGEMYDTVNGRKEVVTVIGKIGDDASLFAPNYKRDGYGFIGWSFDPDAGEKVNNTTNKPTIYGPNGIITLTRGIAALADEDRNLTIYAVWVPEETDYTFQTFDKTAFEAANPDKKVIALEDERDHNTYAVIKQADGKWWMVENLRLNPADTNTTINASNTNQPTNSFLSKINSVKGTSGMHVPYCENHNSASCTDQISFYEQAIIPTNPSSPNKEWSQTNPRVNGYPNGMGYSWYSYGVYYNNYTANAGNVVWNADYTIKGDICSKGWHIPSGRNGTNNPNNFSNGPNDFMILDQKITGNTTPVASRILTKESTWQDYPYNMVLSGMAVYYNNSLSVSGRGEYIHVWAKSGDVHGYDFQQVDYFYKTTYEFTPYVYIGSSAQNSNHRPRAVRCVAD